MRQRTRLVVWFCWWLVAALATRDSSRSHVAALACPSGGGDASAVVAAPASRSSCAETSSELHKAESVILDFLKNNQSPGKRYRVHGWRWHTMALIRDARRLSNLASRMLENPTASGDNDTLEKAAYHVVDFNMKALHRIEKNLFFPWLQKKLAETDDKDLAKAFSTVLHQVIVDQKEAENIGLRVKECSEKAGSASITDDERLDAIRLTSEMAGELSFRSSQILRREDQFLVPAVALLVSDSEQRSFNNKVIRNLGILDSRMHLVGMYEAVQEKDEIEQQMFQEEIPAIPRYMIPRWKRNLYDPQAGLLEEAV